MITNNRLPVSSEFLQQSIKKTGLRSSFQRVKVLEYFYMHEGHPSVEEIYNALFPSIPSLSRTTIYNTIHKFVSAGLLREINFDVSEGRYDLTLHDHGHFKCQDCGILFNFEMDIDRLPIKGLGEFHIIERNVYFKGLCPECSEKNQSIKEIKDDK